jgi:DnaJ family protein C protein 17
MAPSDDLKAHAASSQDFYALLDIPSTAAEAEIRRAYRKTALKYHPDKLAKPTPADLDRFHLLQIAYDVLSDPEVRQLYNNAREARERKRRQAEMMDATKRKMKEDLEAREKAGDGAHRGLKRSWVAADVAGNDVEERLEREIQRIAEDGRRKRREAEERLMKEAKQEEEAQKEQHATAKVGEREKHNQRVDRSTEGGANVPELERAVKVRWVREGRGLALNQSDLTTLFTPFGKVENTFMLKDKRQRLGGSSREKKTVATGVVVFSSVVGAHAAVLDSERKRKLGEDNWALIDSVFWASGAGPDLGLNDSALAGGTDHYSCSDNTSKSPSSFQHTPPPATAAQSESSRINHNTDGSVRNNFPSSDAKPSRTVPSFSSFSSRGNSSPSSGDNNSTTTRLGAASFEEVTLMRLKTAQREKERRALEEQIRREDEVADAAAK